MSRCWILNHVAAIEHLFDRLEDPQALQDEWMPTPWHNLVEFNRQARERIKSANERGVPDEILRRYQVAITGALKMLRAVGQEKVS